MVWVRIEIDESEFYIRPCSITVQVIGHIRQSVGDHQHDTWVLDLGVFNEGYNSRAVLMASLSKFSYSEEIILDIQYKEGKRPGLAKIKVLSCHQVGEPVPPTILN